MSEANDGTCSLWVLLTGTWPRGSSLWDVKLAEVFERVAGDLGAELISYEQLTGGSSATVYALDLYTDGQSRRVVYRQYPEHDFKGHEPGSVAIEFGVLRSLHAAGFAVPKPLVLATPDQFLVSEFVEGSSEIDTAQLTDVLDQMADFLVALHAFNPTSIELGHSAELSVFEDPRTGSLRYLPDTDAGRRARDLLTNVRFEVNPLAVLHGDFWPGNVLWLDDQIAAVIDWEDVQLGDPLADLACARVELLCQYGATAMDHFTARYLKHARLASSSLPIWEIYVSSSALATMHLWGLDSHEETRRRVETTSFLDRAISDAERT